mmetsp:Transcript_40721/g.64061  ORF Transcript_40721/g.64061 Transcript_40721/m.64061 type:complete len:238 (-) Transcript_40721:311-1024(-)
MSQLGSIGQGWCRGHVSETFQTSFALVAFLEALLKAQKEGVVQGISGRNAKLSVGLQHLGQEVQGDAVAKSLRDGKAKLDIESITLHRSRVDKNSLLLHRFQLVAIHLKKGLTSDQLVEDDAHKPHVIDWCFFAGGLGIAKVDQFQLWKSSTRCQHDVVELEVVVNHPGVVAVLHRRKKLLHQQSTFFVTKATALEMLHQEVAQGTFVTELQNQQELLFRLIVVQQLRNVFMASELR